LIRKELHHFLISQRIRKALMEKLLSRFPREPYTGQTTMEDMALVQQSPGLPRSLFDTSEQRPKLCWIESCFEVSSSTKRAFMKH
jgi:hypothetical protein